MDNNQEVREQLKQAVDNNDFEAFNSAYVKFLEGFDTFRQSHSDGPAGVIVRNAIFGRKNFHLKQTNDEQAETLLTEGRAVSKVFGSLPLEDKLEFLKTLQSKIDKYKESIMLTITADTGKPYDLAKGEMDKGNEWFRYAYEEADKQIGTKGKGRLTGSLRPLGVAQIIGAYNYPYALAIGGIVGALTAGNSVVVASPLKAPNWVFPFMQAAQEAIKEFSDKAIADNKPWAESFAEVAPALVRYNVGVNPNLTAQADVVHFVGGDKTGEIIRKSRNGKRTILELGGSNVVTVMASAVTDEKEAEKIAQTIYGGFGPATGQRCTAPRILCVENGAEAVAAKLGAICDEGEKHIGNPFHDGVKMGPLVDAGAHQKMQEAIALATELGATVHGRLKVGDNIVPQAREKYSFWVNPIVIDWTNADMSRPENAERVYNTLKDEIFGPLLHIVHPVKNLDEAIAITNKLDSHGLAGAIFTNDPADVEKYQDKIGVTSLTWNGMPKDQSPHGVHGHPGLDTIGGDSHFGLYGSRRVLSDMRARA